jgi:hypothetical protein
MFVAKFTQTTGEPFNADKNNNFPFIGEVLAGSAKGTLINGTMFIRNGMEPNKLYACENFVDPDYPTNQQVRMIAEVSVKDFLSLRTELGAPKNSYQTATAGEDMDNE